MSHTLNRCTAPWASILWVEKKEMQHELGILVIVSPFCTSAGTSRSNCLDVTVGCSITMVMHGMLFWYSSFCVQCTVCIVIVVTGRADLTLWPWDTTFEINCSTTLWGGSFWTRVIIFYSVGHSFQESPFCLFVHAEGDLVECVVYCTCVLFTREYWHDSVLWLGAIQPRFLYWFCSGHT